MDIKNEKLQLIEWLAGLTSTSILKEFIALKKERQKDWWLSLSKDQQEDIEAGVADLEAGKKKDLKRVLSKYR